jgi:hypothetical protein
MPLEWPISDTLTLCCDGFSCCVVRFVSSSRNSFALYHHLTTLHHRERGKREPCESLRPRRLPPLRHRSLQRA